MLTVRFDELGLHPGDLLLDMGCGAGRHAFECYRLGARTVAFDYSAAELKDVGGLFAATQARLVVPFLSASAAVYGVLTVYGIVVDQTSEENFVPVNSADNWLHLVLTIGMAALAWVVNQRLHGGHFDYRHRGHHAQRRFDPANLAGLLQRGQHGRLQCRRRHDGEVLLLGSDHDGQRRQLRDRAEQHAGGCAAK